ncbi:hypothetical protein FEM48_Zijuj09G0180100 [Ziziphus jujuba var. spinosa]|uniref:Uncharacterized protein n=1 Tax=Ziziphus jujuba var. spinosa TaxID=714518 RepID=A0A978UUG7_ZIZJJ|nr:hypothetical protein FEM48_Zijuj09G0180100 [Ziziphus jujuba var. spinosa]
MVGKDQRARARSLDIHEFYRKSNVCLFSDTSYCIVYVKDVEYGGMSCQEFATMGGYSLYDDYPAVLCQMFSIWVSLLNYDAVELLISVSPPVLRLFMSTRVSRYAGDVLVSSV